MQPFPSYEGAAHCQSCRKKDPGKETSAGLEVTPGVVVSGTLHQTSPAPTRETNNLMDNLLKQAKHSDCFHQEKKVE